MTNEIRFRNFLADLDQILQENVDCMIDEQGNAIEHDITEEVVYGWIMENEEYHLLTSERVKGVIHQFMTDFRLRMEILYTYKLV